VSGADAEHQAATSPGSSLGTLLHGASPIVAVRVTSEGRHLEAIARIAAGTMLYALTGRETDTPTRYSVQIGPARHLDQECARDLDDVVQHYFWRYMNHSCDPSTVIRDRQVFALRDLMPGDAVTFDYNTTEWEMAEPFACHCRASWCVGTVRGARHLSPAQRTRVADQLSPWLLD
jgi:hypothetical protein